MTTGERLLMMAKLMEAIEELEKLSRVPSIAQKALVQSRLSIVRGHLRSVQRAIFEGGKG